MTVTTFEEWLLLLIVSMILFILGMAYGYWVGWTVRKKIDNEKYFEFENDEL